jgi:hypothetical protein
LNKLAAVAEEQGHHPDVALTGYRNVTVTLSTFSIGGLHDNDFILGKNPSVLIQTFSSLCTDNILLIGDPAAAKSDSIPVEYSPKFLRENPNVTAGIPR